MQTREINERSNSTENYELTGICKPTKPIEDCFHSTFVHLINKRFMDKTTEGSANTLVTMITLMR